MKRPLLSLKDSVWKRAKNRCEKCGAKIVKKKAGNHNGSVHHRKPRRMRGVDSVMNCMLVCNTCHRDIHRDELAAAREGWIAWGEEDVTPVLLHTGGWVLLVPDGTYEYLSHREAERLIEYLNGCRASSSPEALATA